MAGIGLLASAIAGGRPLRRAVLRTVLAMCLAWITVSLIRRGFPLPRPAAFKLGSQWLAHSGSAGFPSHHAAGAFACWAALALSPALRARRPLVLAGLAIAAAIAWSRVYLGVHFPKDVLVGAATGCVAALLVSAVADRAAAAMAARRGRTLPGAAPAPVLVSRGEP